MKVLVLEDNKERIAFFDKHMYGKFVVFARTVKGAKEAVKKHNFDIMYLDHDLGTKQTGYDFVNWLISRTPRTGATIIIHSMDTPGATKMDLALDKCGFKVVRMPFGYLRDRYEGLKRRGE